MSRRPFEVGDVVRLRLQAHGSNNHVPEWNRQGMSAKAGDLGQVTGFERGRWLKVTILRTGYAYSSWSPAWFDLVEAADET